MESEQVKLNNLEILRNSNHHSLELFNLKLNKNSEVKASCGTMIKVTYKKECKSPALSNCSSSSYSDYYNDSNCNQAEKRSASVCSYNGSHSSIVSKEGINSVSDMETNNTEFLTIVENKTDLIDNGCKVESEEIKCAQGINLSSLVFINSNERTLNKEMGVESKNEIRKRTTENSVDNAGSKKLRVEPKPEIYVDDSGATSSDDDEEEEGEEDAEDDEDDDDEEGEVGEVGEEEVEDDNDDDDDDDDEDDDDDNDNDNEEEELLLDDPNLPPGWQRIIHTRRGGASDGQNDVHILSPDGKRFRFRAKLKKFLEETNSPYSIDRFYFGLYKKKEHRSSHKVKTKKDVENFKGKKKKNQVPVLKNKPGAFKPRSRSLPSSSDFKDIKVINSSNLPTGWKKCVILRKNHKNQDKKRICYVSPDGKKFKQKKRLSDFLTSKNMSCNIDLFDFEDDTTPKRVKRKYVKKKDKLAPENKTPETLNKTSESVNKTPETEKSPVKKQLKYSPKKEEKSKESPTNHSETSKSLPLSPLIKPVPREAEKRKSAIPTGSNAIPHMPPQPEKKKSRYQYNQPPMMIDPHLPPGWKRTIKIRNYGDSAGRMEVIIISPDGRKHRNRGALEQYLCDKKLPYAAADFDFCVFGRNHKKSPVKSPVKSPAKHSKPLTPRTSFQADRSFKENDVPVITPESAMISHVSGMMLTCGVTSLRNERRLRMSKEEHEKVLKDYFESNKSSESMEDSSDVPTKWIQDLAKCRSEFGSLSDNAATAIASATKEFLQEFVVRALQNAKSPETGLEYNDVADFVEKSDCLSPLKVLIPKKITFKEYVKLSRPKKYVTF